MQYQSDLFPAAADIITPMATNGAGVLPKRRSSSRPLHKYCVHPAAAVRSPRATTRYENGPARRAPLTIRNRQTGHDAGLLRQKYSPPCAVSTGHEHPILLRRAGLRFCCRSAAKADFLNGMAQQAIVGFHQDEQGDWVADLACGHTQHVRHRPPWELRPWVTTEEGRRAHLGWVLQCRKCDEGSGG
jgi:hypothetical protein